MNKTIKKSKVKRTKRRLSKKIKRHLSKRTKRHLSKKTKRHLSKRVKKRHHKKKSYNKGNIVKTGGGFLKRRRERLKGVAGTDREQIRVEYDKAGIKPVGAAEEYDVTGTIPKGAKMSNYHVQAGRGSNLCRYLPGAQNIKLGRIKEIIHCKNKQNCENEYEEKKNPDDIDYFEIEDLISKGFNVDRLIEFSYPDGEDKYGNTIMKDVWIPTGDKDPDNVIPTCPGQDHTHGGADLKCGERAECPSVHDAYGNLILPRARALANYEPGEKEIKETGNQIKTRSPIHGMELLDREIAKKRMVKPDGGDGGDLSKGQRALGAVAAAKSGSDDNEGELEIAVDNSIHETDAKTKESPG